MKFTQKEKQTKLKQYIHIEMYLHSKYSPYTSTISQLLIFQPSKICLKLVTE